MCQIGRLERCERDAAEVTAELMLKGADLVARIAMVSTARTGEVGVEGTQRTNDETAAGRRQIVAGCASRLLLCTYLVAVHADVVA